MLREVRATQTVYDSANDVLEVRAEGSDSRNTRPGPPERHEAMVTLLLSSSKGLVGVDLRDTSAECVLMLGPHEDVANQVQAYATVELDAMSDLVALKIKKASKTISSPAKNPYV
jgi:hypothetical protein